jgi:hypothetical protein
MAKKQVAVAKNLPKNLAAPTSAVPLGDEVMPTPIAEVTVTPEATAETGFELLTVCCPCGERVTRPLGSATPSEQPVTVTCLACGKVLRAQLWRKQA